MPAVLYLLVVTAGSFLVWLCFSTHSRDGALRSMQIPASGGLQSALSDSTQQNAPAFVAGLVANPAPGHADGVADAGGDPQIPPHGRRKSNLVFTAGASGMGSKHTSQNGSESASHYAMDPRTLHGTVRGAWKNQFANEEFFVVADPVPWPPQGPDTSAMDRILALDKWINDPVCSKTHGAGLIRDWQQSPHQTCLEGSSQVEVAALPSPFEYKRRTMHFVHVRLRNVMLTSGSQHKPVRFHANCTPIPEHMPALAEFRRSLVPPAGASPRSPSCRDAAMRPVLVTRDFPRNFQHFNDHVQQLYLLLAMTYREPYNGTILLAHGEDHDGGDAGPGHPYITNLVQAIFPAATIRSASNTLPRTPSGHCHADVVYYAERGQQPLLYPSPRHEPASLCLCPSCRVYADALRAVAPHTVHPQLGEVSRPLVAFMARSQRPEDNHGAHMRRRQIQNQEEVIAAIRNGCKRNDATFMDLHFYGSRLPSIPEQLQWVHQIDIMVGMTGAGLAWSLAMRPGSYLVMIVPETTASSYETSYHDRQAIRVGLGLTVVFNDVKYNANVPRLWAAVNTTIQAWREREKRQPPTFPATGA